MENPVISAGSTSGVNCTRFWLMAHALENASAIVVFPTPGISSIRMCPLARMAIITISTQESFPMTAFLTSSITFNAFTRYIVSS